MREPKIQVVETEEKRTVILSREAEADYHAIIYGMKEITKSPLTEQQADNFMRCLLEVCFMHNDDVFEMEEKIAEMAEVLAIFAEKLKGGGADE